jgi:myo-inositol-1-phosphate synthase
LWLIGAYGGVATTVTLGLAAMASGRSRTTGLVSALPMWDGLELPAPGDFVVGGHEIRAGSFEASAEEFRAGSGVFDAELLAACRPALEAASARVRPGTVLGSNDAITRLATWDAARQDADPAAAVGRLAGDLEAFATAERLDHVIVLNVSSTEPPHPRAGELAGLASLDEVLHGGDPDALPSSTLYALAAVSQGYSYVNFTPSLGASPAAIRAMAGRTGALLAGKDGKTGETLMKTVLAPMFAARNLEVLSWVGHNIFGNRDGLILDSPTNKASKVTTKDQVVTQILGYKPNTLVSIEYVPDMGDWKTAWDHIHFKGFLGCAMTLQFTWQGCDSLLAAPLAIDLARLVDLAKRRGATGLQTHLAPFFKSPEGVAENDFFRQTFALEAYAASLREG